MTNLRFMVLALATVLLVFASCKKEKEEEPGHDYGPANTMTIDGKTLPISSAFGWEDTVGGKPQDDLTIAVYPDHNVSWLTLSVSHDKYGVDYPLVGSDKYWRIGYYGSMDNQQYPFMYECFWNDTPPTVTGGHVYIQRTGASSTGGYGTYIMRFEIVFADGHKMYGNYSGDFGND